MGSLTSCLRRRRQADPPKYTALEESKPPVVDTDVTAAVADTVVTIVPLHRVNIKDQIFLERMLMCEGSDQQFRVKNMIELAAIANMFFDLQTDDLQLTGYILDFSSKGKPRMEFTIKSLDFLRDPLAVMTPHDHYMLRTARSDSSGYLVIGRRPKASSA